MQNVGLCPTYGHPRNISGALWWKQIRPICQVPTCSHILDANAVFHWARKLVIGDFPNRVFHSTYDGRGKCNSETRTNSTTPSFRFLMKMAASIRVNKTNKISSFIWIQDVRSCAVIMVRVKVSSTWQNTIIMVASYIMLARSVGRFFTVLQMNFPVTLIAEDVCGRWLGLCRYRHRSSSPCLPVSVSHGL